MKAADTAGKPVATLAVRLPAEEAGAALAGTAAPQAAETPAEGDDDAGDEAGEVPEEEPAAEGDAAKAEAMPLFDVPKADVDVTLHFILDPPRWTAARDAFPATVANS